MIVALGTVGILGGVNLVGLLVSLWLEHRGIPAGWDAQVARRKPGSLKKRLPLIFFNLFLLFATSLPALWFFADHFPLGLPKPALLLAQIVLVVVVDDVWFYWLHRLIHVNKTLYRRIHKVHHEAYAPVPIEYIYAHPLEWMLGSLGPMFGVLLVMAIFGDMSVWSLWIWGAFRALHEMDIHSGVRNMVGRHLPLFATTEHHDLHHARPTKGNYASTLTLWDRVFGTLVTVDEVHR